MTPIHPCRHGGWGAAGRRVARLVAGVFLAMACAAPGAVVFETTSSYHHIRVVDDGGIRTLLFDNAMQTRMALRAPLTGHFDYVESFHLPWLWNARITNVLMIGLGGASVQRSYRHYYPEVCVDTIELDPAVIRVAADYFHYSNSPTHRIILGDGRPFIRHTTNRYDVILLDAYTASPYGAFLPHALVTKEFFTLATARLSTNGVLAYNVMGDLNDGRENVLGALYNTLKSVFPQVYVFPAQTSKNVVLLGTRQATRVEVRLLQQRAAYVRQSGRALPPWIEKKIHTLRSIAPAAANNSSVLTDDYAPVDGLLHAGW